MGRALAALLVGGGYTALAAWAGMLIERRRRPSLARERERMIRAAGRASAKGRHGEAELWERALAGLKQERPLP